MERKTDLERAAELFEANFIGPVELYRCSSRLGVEVPLHIPQIPYNIDFLKTKKDDHLLFLSASHMLSGELITLLSLRNFFGIDPAISEPCFYNQDWYIKEDFFQIPLSCKWNLISITLIEKSRGLDPDRIIPLYNLPSAVLCSYVFFLFWFHSGKYLWENDFVWCSDKDHNEDQIYMGRYIDANGINKNGLEIHRHLSIRSYYGAIDYHPL